MLIIRTLAFVLTAGAAVYIIFFTTFVESLFLRLTKRKVTNVVTGLAADVKKTAKDQEQHLKRRRVELDGEISTLQNLQFSEEAQPVTPKPKVTRKKKEAVPTSAE